MPRRRAPLTSPAFALAVTVAIAVTLTSCGGGGGGGVPCPADLRPIFDDINAKVLTGCGVTGNSCHSPAGAVDSGELDLATDPFTALLGTDGTGAHANNIAGSVRNLRRVVPGDAASSFLLIKLMTTSQNDPRYGAGMPLPGPGGLCPSAQDAIQAWITTGAQR